MICCPRGFRGKINVNNIRLNLGPPPWAESWISEGYYGPEFPQYVDLNHGYHMEPLLLFARSLHGFWKNT